MRNARDLAAHAIRSDTIAPTCNETPTSGPFLQDAAFRESVGQVEDVLGAIVLLASDAPSMVAGTAWWSTGAGRRIEAKPATA